MCNRSFILRVKWCDNGKCQIVRWCVSGVYCACIGCIFGWCLIFFLYVITWKASVILDESSMTFRRIEGAISRSCTKINNLLNLHTHNTDKQDTPWKLHHTRSCTTQEAVPHKKLHHTRSRNHDSWYYTTTTSFKKIGKHDTCWKFNHNHKPWFSTAHAT